MAFRRALMCRRSTPLDTPTGKSWKSFWQSLSRHPATTRIISSTRRCIPCSRSHLGSLSNFFAATATFALWVSPKQIRRHRHRVQIEAARDSANRRRHVRINTWGLGLSCPLPRTLQLEERDPRCVGQVVQKTANAEKGFDRISEMLLPSRFTSDTRQESGPA